MSHPPRQIHHDRQAFSDWWYMEFPDILIAHDGRRNEHIPARIRMGCINCGGRIDYGLNADCRDCGGFKNSMSVGASMAYDDEDFRRLRRCYCRCDCALVRSHLESDSDDDSDYVPSVSTDQDRPEDEEQNGFNPLVDVAAGNYRDEQTIGTPRQALAVGLYRTDPVNKEHEWYHAESARHFAAAVAHDTNNPAESAFANSANQIGSGEVRNLQMISTMSGLRNRDDRIIPFQTTAFTRPQPLTTADLLDLEFVNPGIDRKAILRQFPGKKSTN